MGGTGIQQNNITRSGRLLFLAEKGEKRMRLPTIRELMTATSSMEWKVTRHQTFQFE
jgi:hypothetical protein